MSRTRLGPSRHPPRTNLASKFGRIQQPANPNPVSGQDVVRVMPADIAEYCKSKQDLLDILAYEGQYLLPAQDDITMDFLKQVLAGKKALLKQSQVQNVKVPKLKEFNANELFTGAMQDAKMSRYLPDPSGSRKRTVGRAYLFA